MIVDHKSQIADDRKESCFHIIGDNHSKQYGRRRGGNFVASKFISSFSQSINFEIPLALHLAPIQKVAFSVASDNDHTQFLCCGI